MGDHSEFSPRDYAEQFYMQDGQGAKEDGPKYANFIYPKMAECFEAIPDQAKGPDKRILEIGCGPTIMSAALASKHFGEIILSDLIAGNLQEVCKWLNKEPGASNWMPMLHFLAKVDGSDSNEMAQRIRSSVKRHVLGNVLLDGILKEPCGKFDAVVSLSCLIAACKTKELFGDSLKRIAALIVPNGHLVLVTTLENNFYMVSGKRFQNLSLQLDEVHKFVQEAGFRLLRSYYEDMERTDFRFSGFKSANVLLARKL